MQIHQVLAAAAYGDAVTNEAVALRDVFRRAGQSDIFAHNSDGRVPEVRRLTEFPARTAGRGERVVLLHCSIGEPAVTRFLADRAEPIVLRYHNITPPEFYEGHDRRLAHLLALGREELRQLRPRVAAAFAVSAFNADDLRELGYTDPVVVPLVHDTSRLLPLKLKEPLARLPGPEAGPAVLFVGRLAPNKGQHLLIQAFHVLKTYLRPDVHLMIAGRPSPLTYAHSLEQFVSELALPDVRFFGHVPDAELAAIYRRADLLCCLSAHEGFGVPLLEAMAFDIPVVAWATSAVRDTVGDAGLLLPDPKPAVVAEALHRVLSDAGLRRRLVTRGRRRLSQFDWKRSGQLMLEEVRRAAASSRALVEAGP